MSKDIATLFGITDGRRQEGTWGVEIEVEGTNLPDDLPIDKWRIEQDGSLKGDEAFEYVMPKPLSLAGVRASLDVLAASYKSHKTKVDESIRAGVHVHMNVQDWNVKQLMTFATCFYILEELLVKWCGENREGNLFCLRTRDAEYVLYTLLDAMETRNLRHLSTEDIRYSALNFCALGKYGSVEFRSMRGTGNLDLIYEWVEILSELRENSLGFNDPSDVVLSMSGDGEEFFLRRMLPTKHVLFEEFPEFAKTIRRAARRVQMIAFTVDWASMGRPSTNPFRQDDF